MASVKSDNGVATEEIDLTQLSTTVVLTLFFMIRKEPRLPHSKVKMGGVVSSFLQLRAKDIFNSHLLNRFNLK